jgi:hypothetical protein
MIERKCEITQRFAELLRSLVNTMLAGKRRISGILKGVDAPWLIRARVCATIPVSGLNRDPNHTS